MLVPNKTLIFVMSIWNNAWAVYGVVVDIASSCETCTPIPFETPSLATFTTASSSPPPQQSSSESNLHIIVDSATSPRPARSTPTLSYNSTIHHTPSSESFLEPILSAISTAPTPSAAPSHSLTLATKIIIGSTVGLLGLALVFGVLLEVCYLRRKRREKATQNAVEEVERRVDKSGEERIVLESRVSIIIDEDWEEEGERNDDEYEGEDEDEDEGPRNGMRDRGMG